MKKINRFLFIIICVFFSTFTLAQTRNYNQSVLNDSLISFYTEQVNKDSIQNYISMLENMETRFMMAPNRKAVAETIMTKFLSLGVEMVRIDSVLCTNFIDIWNLHFDTTTWQYNVIATIPGISNSNEYYLMGAHYDDVVAPNGDPMVFAPGADDNASGVAAMFEVARIIQSNGYFPVKSIELVAFAAEELMSYGNSGSEKYVEALIANGKNIQLMINNDMIAYSEGQPWEIRISNYVGSELLTWLSSYVTESFTDISPVILASSIEGSADCKYFVEAGIPSIYFFEKEFNPFYHTNIDITENCDLAYCAEATKISLGVLIGIDDPSVGFGKDKSFSGLKIYPNPASDIVRICLSPEIKNTEIKYQILDQLGRIIARGFIIYDTDNIINVSNLTDGIYILKLNSSSDFYSSKFIIN